MSYQEQHPNRKFKPSKENEDHDPSEFNRIMHEIAPKQIPSKFVDMIKIIRKDGKITTMTRDDILNSVPVTGPVDWDKVAENYHDIRDMEIYIDMEALEYTVHKNVHRMLGKFFKKSN
tara:strand:+ start:284 stop:637 length:354 start_codon:yes stop_codon:yes gene_type:complete